MQMNYYDKDAEVGPLAEEKNTLNRDQMRHLLNNPEPDIERELFKGLDFKR